MHYEDFASLLSAHTSADNQLLCEVTYCGQKRSVLIDLSDEFTTDQDLICTECKDPENTERQQKIFLPLCLITRIRTLDKLELLTFITEEAHRVQLGINATRDEAIALYA